jgi:Tol biopolymer transport system component
MIRRRRGSLSDRLRRRTLLGGAVLLLALASCDGTQVILPPSLIGSGTVWTRLTSLALEDCLYPDLRGDSLVFTARGIDGGPRITSALSDGTGAAVQNYPGPAAWIDFRPRWCASQRVVYQSNRSGTFDLWFRNLTTGADVRLTSDATNESAPAPRPGSPGLAYVEYDNNAGTPGSDDMRGRIVLIADTAAVTLNKRYLTPDTMRCGEPDWDPTGTRLCFSVENASDLSRHLYTIHLVPGDSIPTQITVGLAHDYAPRWSPDGQRIVFGSDRTGRSGIWVVHPQGEALGLKLVSFDDAGGSVLTPRWTLDGMNIIASSDGRGGVRSLWLLSNLPAFGF